MPLRFAYNTNGLAHHRLDDALMLLADSGYDGVALTLDVQHLDPFAPDALHEATRIRTRCADLGLGVVVETGARFLLDARRKHEPTLVSAEAEGRARRLDFLRRCADLAAALEAEAVSFWAGVAAHDLAQERAWGWLIEGITALVDSHGCGPARLSLEPEPGMVVADCLDWQRVSEEVPGLWLALDTGHCVVDGPHEPQEAVIGFEGRLGTVAVEGMRRGVHEHLPLDEGDVDLPAVLGALTAIGWDRLITVELSRDSHRAHEMVPRALAVLREAEQ